MEALVFSFMVSVNTVLTPTKKLKNEAEYCCCRPAYFHNLNYVRTVVAGKPQVAKVGELELSQGWPRKSARSINKSLQL